MKKECANCINARIFEEENITWCERYDCNINEVAREEENPSCWETLKEYDARRFAVCWECKNFWWAFALKPTCCNGCKDGLPIPCGEPSKECNSFKPIDKQKK